MIMSKELNLATPGIIFLVGGIELEENNHINE
jgi:hypothetical protein